MAAATRSSSDDSNRDTSTAGAPHTLTVAIAIVRDEARVLLVQRRGTDEPDSWQFPAGMVKPGLDPPTVAVRETLCETGVYCAPTGTIGSRVHPRTNVLCTYVLCEYLAGEAENRDPGENVSVTWSQTSKLTRFIPAEQIFPPVLAALEVEP